MTTYFYEVKYSFKFNGWEYGREVYEHRDELMQGLVKMIAKHDYYINGITQFIHKEGRGFNYEYSRDYVRRLPVKLQDMIEENNDYYLICNK